MNATQTRNSLVLTKSKPMKSLFDLLVVFLALALVSLPLTTSASVQRKARGSGETAVKITNEHKSARKMSQRKARFSPSVMISKHLERSNPMRKGISGQERWVSAGLLGTQVLIAGFVLAMASGSAGWMSVTLAGTASAIGGTFFAKNTVMAESVRGNNSSK